VIRPAWNTLHPAKFAAMLTKIANVEGIMSEVENPKPAFEDTGFGPTRWFEDLEIGERYYIPSRTQTDALFAAFQLASADNHPIHYDVEYCRERGHRGLLAHGIQVLAQTAAGAGRFPHAIGDSLIGMIEISAKILKPVYAGDTLYPELEIIALTPQNTTGIVTMRASVKNRAGDLVLDGIHKYLLRKRPVTDEASHD
jgi:acyl dehydratase